jgi:hypothetical protein
MATMRFELVFVGAASVRAYTLPRYRRHHSSLESARAAAQKAYEKMESQGINTAAHQGIVYGPGLGNDGVRA